MSNKYNRYNQNHIEEETSSEVISEETTSVENVEEKAPKNAELVEALSEQLPDHSIGTVRVRDGLTLNVRKAPLADAKVIATIPNGSTVDVTDISDDVFVGITSACNGKIISGFCMKKFIIPYAEK